MPLRLSTPRLRLEPLHAGHVDDLVALDADPEVMRYINGGAPTPREVYERDLLARLTSYDDAPFGFAAAYSARAEAPGFLGWFHLRPSVQDARRLEVGYRLRREAWGRGLATEGTRALVAYAFDELGERELDACTHLENAASMRVLEKCGFERRGVFVHPRVPLHVAHFVASSPRAAFIRG